MNRKDFILIGAVVAIALIAFGIMPLFQQDGAYVAVRVNGEVVAEYSLAKDGEYALNGGTNILRIEGGQAFLVAATCPDHLCVNYGKISRSGETITCLPNRLTVTVYGAEKNNVDLIS